MSKKHTNRNAFIAFFVIVACFIGVIILLDVTGVADTLNNDDDNGYAGSGISENDWFDGDLDWTEYEHPDDATVTIQLPKDDFIIEEHAHYDEFNASNITELGGFLALWAETEDPDDWDSPIDSMRVFIVLYATFANDEYDCSDLYDLLSELLELTDEWEIHDDSGEEWTVDDHGLKAVTLYKAENETEHMIGMYAYVCYLCDENDRTYLIFYAVAKDSELNEWSDRAFQAEAKYVFESFTCHD